MTISLLSLKELEKSKPVGKLGSQSEMSRVVLTMSRGCGAQRHYDTTSGNGTHRSIRVGHLYELLETSRSSKYEA